MWDMDRGRSDSPDSRSSGVSLGLLEQRRRRLGTRGNRNRGPCTVHELFTSDLLRLKVFETPVVRDLRTKFSSHRD